MGITEAEVQLLYQRFSRPIYSFFTNRGFGKDESRDLTQETFLQLHRSADRFQARSDHSTWVFSIAKNIWLQTLRDTGRAKRNAETVSLDALQEAGTLVPNWAESDRDKVLQRILGEERERLLKLAINTLPKQMKSCVFLHFMQGRRQSEIALLLGLSEGTVKFHLSQARAKLRDQLAEHFPDIV